MRSKEDFIRVCKAFPEYERFRMTGTDEQGFIQFSCNWLTAEKICKDYENRLAICRKFPGKSLHFCGGGLPVGCGYAIKAVTPFSQVLARQLKEREREKEDSYS